MEIYLAICFSITTLHQNIVTVLPEWLTLSEMFENMHLFILLCVSERVGRRSARTARRDGTRDPCGPRPSSHAHLLCSTRDETGRGPVSLRQGSAGATPRRRTTWPTRYVFVSTPPARRGAGVRPSFVSAGTRRCRRYLAHHVHNQEIDIY